MWTDVGGIEVVVDDANGQPGLADQQVGLLPCKFFTLIATSVASVLGASVN
jgi:hypothetical protein